MESIKRSRQNSFNEDNSSSNHSSSDNEYSSMNELNPLDYNAMTFQEKFDLAQSLNKGFNGAQHKRLNLAFKSYLMREIDQRTTLNIINEEIGELVHLKITDVSKVSQFPRFHIVDTHIYMFNKIRSILETICDDFSLPKIIYLYISKKKKK